MDGNGRWAQQRGKERTFGHVEGVESVREISDECLRLGIKYVSFFAFSEENWDRPQDEVDTIMELFMSNMQSQLSNFMENGVRYVVIGNRSRLSDEFNKTIDSMMAATAANDKMTMILFVSYSGKWDILQAARRMAADGADQIEPYLATAGIPDPDLIIRTSGEKRISNYLLWQAAYSEFVFTDTLWPDFRKDSFHAALREYASRDRRFGKVKK